MADAAYGARRTCSHREGPRAVRIIWGGAYGGGIWQSTNGHRSLLTSRGENPDDIIVHGRNIWWVDNSTSDNIYEATIRVVGGRVQLVGYRVVVHVSNGAERIDQMALDSQHIYWLAVPGGASGEVIGRADRDGSNVEPAFITDGTSSATAIAVSGSYIYWAANAWTGIDSLGRARVDGTDVMPSFMAGLSENNPTSLLITSGLLYWATGDGSIGRVRIDGTSVSQSFITGVGNAYGLATDGRSLYCGRLRRAHQASAATRRQSQRSDRAIRR